MTHIVQREPILKIRPDMSRTGRSKEAVERLGYMPIYEKENAFTYLNQYEQVAIIDSDIYIRQQAPNIFWDLTEEYAFGAVAERELPCAKKYKSKIRKYSKSAFENLTDVNWKWNELGAEFYNMGMMVINSKKLNALGQTAEQFIDVQFRDFVDGIDTRVAHRSNVLNYWVKKENIPTKNLDWKWNGLYKGIDDKRLPEAHFIHFFLKDLLPERGENVTKLMEAIG